MPYLELNGFAVDAQANSANSVDDGPRTQERMYSGKVFRDEVADFQKWSFTSGVLTVAERDELRHLVRGDGEHWSFDVDAFGSKGTGMTGAHTISATDPKFGAGRLEPSASVSFSPGFLAGLATYTVAYWRDETAGPGASWRHVISNSAGQKWNNGVLDAGLSIAELSVVSGVVTLSTAYEAYDDLVILPWSITDPFGNSYPQAVAYSDLPKLTATGDEFERPPVTVMGDYNGATELTGAGTSFYRSAFELWET